MYKIVINLLPYKQKKAKKYKSLTMLITSIIQAEPICYLRCIRLFNLNKSFLYLKSNRERYVNSLTLEFNIFRLVNFIIVVTCSRPRGGANADGNGRLDGNGFTNAPPPLNGLPVVLADVTAGCKKCGGKPCKR